MANVGLINDVAADRANNQDGMSTNVDWSQYVDNNVDEANSSERFGKTWLGEFLGFGDDADRLEWRRSEQAANNAFYRDMMGLQAQQKFNAVEAQKDREFQERMSNTAYQRAMADLKASGLNPVLAYSNGSASTPSGASATSGSASGIRSNYSRRSGNGSELVSALVNIASGIYGLVKNVGSKPRIGFKTR